jgi:hypothetical protein
MNDTPDTTNACLEGADIPREPIRVVMYGDHFASIDGELMMSASGPNARRTIARRLLAMGYDADRQLDTHRGGKREAPLSLRDAAQQGDNHA